MNISHLRPHLDAAASAVVATGYWTGPHRALRSSRKETEYVASLIEACVLHLTRAWGGILDPLNLDLALHGAFLHQRPYVRFHSPTATSCGPQHCELADLMLVVDFEAQERRACLIQAKRDPGAGVVGDQKDLYERWDSLRFAHRTKGAQGRVYSVSPNGPGSRYGVVRTDPALGEAPWRLQDPLGRGADVDMGEFLADMLIATVGGGVGAGRRADFGGGDDWSCLVKDLLQASLHSKYPLKGFWPAESRRVIKRPITAFLLDDPNGWEIVSSTVGSVLPPIGPPEEPGEDAPRDGPGRVTTLYARVTRQDR